MTAEMTPETIAELRRLLDGCQPGRVIVNDLRPTHNAIWLDSRYDSDDGWESLRTLAEIDTETETVEVLWGLDDAVLIAAAINALPALLDAAAERDTLRAERDALAAAVGRVRALHVEEHVYIGPGDPIGGFICRACGEPVESEPCPTVRALDEEARP